MPLIECPDCNKQISDKASSCPECGCPALHKAPTQPQSTAPEVSTIQATGKQWKGLQLISILVLLIGVVVTIATSSGNPTIGIIMIIGGFIGYIGSRFFGWWHHG